MKIKVLGTGCPNCKKLEANVNEVLENLKIEAVVEKITDIEKIMSYGVMGTPALVIDEEVKSYGRVLSSGEIEEILKNSGSGNLPSTDKRSGCCSCSCGGNC